VRFRSRNKNSVARGQQRGRAEAPPRGEPAGLGALLALSQIDSPEALSTARCAHDGQRYREATLAEYLLRTEWSSVSALGISVIEHWGTRAMEGLLSTIIDAWHRRTMMAKLFSFASIGVVNVAVDVSAFTVAFKLAGLPLVLSNIVAWLVAVTGSYAMNTKITFGRETGGLYSLGRFASFAASGVFGLIVATIVLVTLSQYVDVPFAKLASIAAAFGVNFSASHFFVFRMPRAG
jgi:putative flippase GtrA